MKLLEDVEEGPDRIILVVLQRQRQVGSSYLPFGVGVGVVPAVRNKPFMTYSVVHEVTEVDKDDHEYLHARVTTAAYPVSRSS